MEKNTHHFTLIASTCSITHQFIPKANSHHIIPIYPNLTMKTNVAIPSFHRSKRTNPLANLHFNTTALEAWFEARKAIMTAKMGGMKTRKAAAREEAEFEKMKEKSRKEYEKNVEKWRSWPNGKKKASFTITEESEEAEQLARVRLAFL